ncbi:APC family permease [Bellilinea sp.]|uniref:APC family permease n=1 Tax=Bellilinea sp. TaxID=2838785 RepID=UPI002ADDF91B|nr:APC family permease [Bellilinea sp.]
MNIEDQTGTTVLRRETEVKPKKSWRTWLIGRPLPTADAPHQTIGVLIGLAVFASDALSSTAYATQEMLVILMILGERAYDYVFPLAIGIVLLLTIVTLSYEQTVHAYPNGGGAYTVSRDNLGVLPSKIAAAALLTDYILTVSVSISSGVAQIVSAIPELFPYRVWVAIGFIFFIMVMNLRGVKESGRAFAVPTYFFVVMMYLTVIVGLIRYFGGTLGLVANPPPIEVFHGTAGVGIFLILRAFSSGTAALTGIEAISNGIPAFKEPRSKNAGTTLIIMSIILGSLMLGISFLAGHIRAVPSEIETVISQLARTAFDGRGVFYSGVILATTVILIMAANTAFADFPRLSAIAATDGLLPRQLTYRGSRLVYSRGIVLLAMLATLLIVIFQASVTRLIPLYAVGVFLSFTLSQAGMAHRWWKIGRLKEGETLKERGSVLRYDPNWLIKMLINGFGAFCTGVVMLVFAATKFVDGAWVVIVIIPTLVVIFSAIQRHYRHLAARLSLENYGGLPRIARHRVIIPISGVHRGTLAALRYARTLSEDITAVHVSIDPQEAEKVRQKWETWGDGRRLVILESPYRLFIEPLLEYIDEIESQRQPNEIITIVVPEFVPRHWWAGLLHTQTALTLRMALLFHKDIVITSVPYQVD